MSSKFDVILLLMIIYLQLRKQDSIWIRGSCFLDIKRGTKIKGRMKVKSMTYMLKKYKKQFGLSWSERKVSKHSMRSSGAICKLLQGESLEKVMRDGCWRSPRTVLKYFRLMEVLSPWGFQPDRRITQQDYMKLNRIPLLTQFKW